MKTIKNILLFIWKYFWLIVLGVVFIPVALRLLKENKIKVDKKVTTANSIFDKLGVPQSARARLNETALQIAHNLGTAYSMFNFKYWTENDLAVFNLVKDLTQSDFDIVKQLYFNVYAKGNNLSVDLAKLLDDEYFKQLKIK